MKRVFYIVIVLFLLFAGLAEDYSCPRLADASGEDVQCLQMLLNYRGYSVGLSDSGYNFETDVAISKWCDACHWSKQDVTLNDVFIGLVKEGYTGYNLDFSTNYFDVRAVQILLRRWGFYSGEITGERNSELELAISRFKNYRTGFDDVNDGIVVDADAFSDGSIEVYDYIDDVSADVYTKMLYHFSPVTAPISYQSLSDDIRRLKTRLYTVGYYKGNIDGVWSDDLFSALSCFQYDNNIFETDCGSQTQNLLFSERAEVHIDLSKGYKIYVNTKESYVSVFGWVNGGFNKEVQHFICSCGADKSPTIKGNFTLEERRGEWYQISHDPVGWVQYAYRFVGHYYFHSVLFSKKGSTKPTAHSQEDLGTNVSAGCVRLSVEDCKWIYENCEVGTPVLIE